jgi:predicted HTH transcriptional regulator
MISIDEAICGGLSSPRNSTIMTMFTLLDIGEKAGSGVPSIFKAWEEQEWDMPVYTEMNEPDRTILTLKFMTSSDKQVSTADDKNKVAIKNKKSKSSDKQEAIKSKNQKKAILKLIRQQDEVKSSDLIDVLNVSEQRIRRLLLEMVNEGVIISLGSNRNRRYRLPLR